MTRQTKKLKDWRKEIFSNKSENSKLFTTIKAISQYLEKLPKQRYKQ